MVIVASGTSRLYAALDIAGGRIIGSLARHRGSEFLSFLHKIDANGELT